MFVLRIDHRVADYDSWKQAFDADPADRKGSGVRSYRVSRAVDDPDHVVIDLEFDTLAAAQGLLASMREVWQVVEPAGLVEGPQARIVEVVETREY